MLGSGEKIILSQSKLMKIDWPSNLEFCGEKVPLENFYIREAWEKEFLVTLARDYQNILYLKRSPKYFPLIESELASRNFPDDLKFLAVAESALREDIRSSAGAEGIWQFIPETGQRYGLRVDGEIDERKNFEKATPAALDYLEFLHEKFDSWTLAAAAYNAGENGIARRLGEQMVGDYYDLYLNEETSRYLFRSRKIWVRNRQEWIFRMAKFGTENGSRTNQRFSRFREKQSNDSSRFERTESVDCGRWNSRRKFCN